MKALIKHLIGIVDRNIYRNRCFAIISNNCWGAEVYKRLSIQYTTPFVGLFLFGPDYIKLLEKLSYYLSLNLKFKKGSRWTIDVPKYPIGELGDIEIHFMHYSSEGEAKSKWERRLLRMQNIDYNHYFFKICDRDYTSIDIIDRFHNLPFKNKISFGITKLHYCNHFLIKESVNGSTVPDGLTLYNITSNYFDVLNWINTGKITNTWYNKCKSILNIF